MIGFLLLLLVFLFSVAPSIHWLDATEFVIAPWVFGIEHPPGQVPQVFWGAFFQLMPWGDPGFRVSLGSAVATALSAYVVYSWVLKEVETFSSQAKKEARLLLQGMAGAIALTSLLALQAMRPEVYALVTLLTLTSIALSRCKEDCRFIYLSYLAFGFALTLHPMVALVAIPFLAKPKRFASMLWAGMGGLVLIYLPLRSVQNPSWDFGTPARWERFIWFLRGDLYKAYHEVGASTVAGNAQGLGEMILGGVPWLVLGLALIGTVVLIRRSQELGFRYLLATAFGLFPLLFMANFWPENPDAMGYLGPVVWLLLLPLGFLVISACNRWALNRVVRLGLMAMVGFWVLFALMVHFQDGTLSRDWSAHAHARRLMEEPRAGDEVRIASFSTFGFLKYGQSVEGLRPDLELIYRGLPKKEPSDSWSALEPRGLTWELAIWRDAEGRYTLRSKDRGLLDQLQPTGWFYRERSVSFDGWQRELKVRTKAVLRDLSPVASFGKEPLILNHLLHILFARMRSGSSVGAELEKDFHELYPRVVGFELLDLQP